LNRSCTHHNQAPPASRRSPQEQAHRLQAHSGNDALEKIIDDPSIEILITDINMPELSGTELAQRARSFRDQLHVILLSGRESDSHGYPLIRKPILRSDLQRVVAETSGPC
jgi:CheY-like chemotaxis protein